MFRAGWRLLQERRTMPKWLRSSGRLKAIVELLSFQRIAGRLLTCQFTSSSAASAAKIVRFSFAPKIGRARSARLAGRPNCPKSFRFLLRGMPRVMPRYAVENQAPAACAAQADRIRIDCGLRLKPAGRLRRQLDFVG